MLIHLRIYCEELACSASWGGGIQSLFETNLKVYWDISTKNIALMDIFLIKAFLKIKTEIKKKRILLNPELWGIPTCVLSLLINTPDVLSGQMKRSRQVNRKYLQFPAVSKLLCENCRLWPIIVSNHCDETVLERSADHRLRKCVTPSPVTWPLGRSSCRLFSGNLVPLLRLPETRPPQHPADTLANNGVGRRVFIVCF